MMWLGHGREAQGSCTYDIRLEATMKGVAVKLRIGEAFAGLRNGYAALKRLCRSLIMEAVLCGLLRRCLKESDYV